MKELKMTDVILTQERLKELLNYDAETGIFTRKIRTAQRHQVGDRADFIINNGNNIGYLRVSLDSKRYLAHRLAWFYVTGEWPKEQIDHIDGDRSNTCINNLRDVNGRVNVENLHKAKKNSTSGFLGVYPHGKSSKWRARLQVNKSSIHIGLYETKEEAYEAYLRAKRIHHEGCTI